MKQHRSFWKNLKSWTGKAGKEDTVRLKRFFQLVRDEQDKIMPIPSPDFYNRMAGSLRKIEVSTKDSFPYLRYRRRTWPWVSATAVIITVIIAIYSFRAPLPQKLGVDDALFVLTPEVVVLESLSETLDAGSNGISLMPNQESGARSSRQYRIAKI